jgi:hypothetical protein
MMLKVLQRREDAEVEKVDASWEKINKNKCSFGVATNYLLVEKKENECLLFAGGADENNKQAEAEERK